MKIRGTASHIHDKYQSLARDANSSGDRVMAENYLQHAEHYLRLINALQNAASGQGVQPATNGAANGHRAPEEATAEAPQPQPAAAQPQPRAPRGRRRTATVAVPASDAEGEDISIEEPKVAVDMEPVAAAEAEEARAS